MSSFHTKASYTDSASHDPTLQEMIKAKGYKLSRCLHVHETLKEKRQELGTQLGRVLE